MAKNSNLRANSNNAGGRRSGKTAKQQRTKDKGSQASYDEATKQHVSAPNDWRWYVPNEQLLKDTGSLPFTNALGSRDNRGYFGDSYNNYAVPGIMRISYAPVIGYAADTNDPVNICARNIYSFIKSFNSRAKTYDAPDLMMYLIAMDSALAFHAWIKRFYGLMNTTSFTNRYYPAAAVEAAGGDYLDLLDHITDLRAYINNFAIRLKALPIPAKLPIFQRHQWLPSGVYLDSAESIKPQSYVFRPIGFYVLELDTDGAGLLKFKTSQSQMTFDDIKSLGEHIIAPLLSGVGEEDFNLIGADILYSYGVDNVLRAETIDQSYSVLPTYDSWVLDQINNLRAYGTPKVLSMVIRQSEDKSYLVQKPVIEWAKDKPWNEAVMDQRVNLGDNDLSPAHVMEATRFMYVPEVKETEDHRELYPVACGTEIATSFQVFYYASQNGRPEDWKLHKSPEYTSTTTMAVDGVAEYNGAPDLNDVSVGQLVDATIGVIDVATEVASFNRHPLMYINFLLRQKIGADGTVVPQTQYSHLELTDFNNHAIIAQSQLAAMNEVAMLGLYGIETYGK